MKTFKTLLKKYEDLAVYMLVVVLLVGFISLMIWSETGLNAFRIIAVCSGFGLPISLGIAFYTMTID